jgi:hypothetical protein
LKDIANEENRPITLRKDTRAPSGRTGFSGGIKEMANFKRGRRKNARSGCLMCKPHKANGACPRHKDMKMGNLRRYEAQTFDMRCEGIKD